YVLHMLNARKGLIKYFPEPMAVYRKHNQSGWSHLKRAEVIERLQIVLKYMLTEDFGQIANERLLIQKRNDQEEYLLSLMNPTNWNLFLERLESFAKEDEFISQK